MLELPKFGHMAASTNQESRKVKKNRNYVSKFNLNLYFLI